MRLKRKIALLLTCIMMIGFTASFPGSFTVTKDYCLVADEGLENISRKVNEYIGLIYANEGFREVPEATDKYIRLTVDKDVKDDNGNSCDYAFTSDGQNITVTGRDKEHVLRGALAFLEEFGGIRCYASDMIIATQTAITYPVELVGHSKAYSDYFEMRDSWLISAQDDDYSWFRGYNANVYRFYVDERQDFETEEEANERITALRDYYKSMGGSVEYISYFCHTFTREFCTPEQYYDTYPECFALDFEGNRRRDELCLSNEKTLEIVTQEVFDLLESDRYDPKAPIQIISLTQNDDGAACQCDQCFIEAWNHGGGAYVNLKFVNEVARAVKNRKQDSKGNPVDYSNVLIDTFAYVYTRSAPTDIIPEDNVIIRLCSFDCCSGHYIDDEDCPKNRAFMKDLEDWSRLTDRLYIWAYSTDFVYSGVPFPDIEVLAHNIRVFYDIGVRGLYIESHQMSGRNLYLDKIGTHFEYAVWRKTEETEFYELRAYVISKVMQNPNCDYHKVMKEFCDGYYGDAGATMYEIVTRMDEYASRDHLWTDSAPKDIMICSEAEITELNVLYAKAVREASDQMEAMGVNGVTDYLKHVKNSEICWRYYKMMCRLFEFSDPSEYESAQEQLYFDFYANNVTRLHDPGSEIDPELEAVESEMLSRYLAEK